MSDAPKPDVAIEAPKVISLFSRKAIEPDHERLAVAAETTPPVEAQSALTTLDGIDQKSLVSLDSAVRAVVDKKATGVCIMALGPNGLPRFWLSFPEGKPVQIEAVRYIGMAKMLGDLLQQVVYNGIENVGEDV